MGRYGGDELMVLMSSSDKMQALAKEGEMTSELSDHEREPFP